MALKLKIPIAKLHKDEKHIQVPTIPNKKKKTTNESKAKRHKRIHK